MQKTAKRRSYAAEKEIEPGKTEMIGFGVLKRLDQWAGLPETGWDLFGVEKPFEPHYLCVEPESADGLEIMSIFVGNRMLWKLRDEQNGVPATRFADEKSPKLPQAVADRGIQITAAVKNVSDKPLIFKAKLVGTEILKSAKDPLASFLSRKTRKAV